MRDRSLASPRRQRRVETELAQTKAALARLRLRQQLFRQRRWVVSQRRRLRSTLVGMMVRSLDGS